LTIGRDGIYIRAVSAHAHGHHTTGDAATLLRAACAALVLAPVVGITLILQALAWFLPRPPVTTPPSLPLSAARQFVRVAEWFELACLFLLALVVDGFRLSSRRGETTRS